MSFGGGFGGFGSNNNNNQSTGFGGFGSSNNNTSTGMYKLLLEFLDPFTRDRSDAPCDIATASSTNRV
jgi:hypothetical protein